jgi:hypothetical protein
MPESTCLIKLFPCPRQESNLDLPLRGTMWVRLDVLPT